MKRVGFVMLILGFRLTVSAQLQDIEQLKLNIEKLVQMKAMLSSMKSGYATLSNGYSQITGLAKGNFELHKNYLDELLQVAAPVRNYPLVESVKEMQGAVNDESNTAYLFYLRSGLFKPAELFEIKKRLDQIKTAVAKQVAHLRVVLTNGVLRMSDEERISAIDRIDKDVGQALGAMRALLSEENALAATRGQQKKNIDAMRLLYGLKK